MLLTFPWCVAVIAGSVPIGLGGEPDYTKKMSESGGLFASGVAFGDEIGTNTKIMLITSMIFLIIQVPAFFTDRIGVSTANQATSENTFALVGALACLAAFVGYVVFCYYQATFQSSGVPFLIDQIKAKRLSIGSVLANYDEHMKHYRPIKKLLYPFFCIYDIDGSGCLDLNEFTHLLRDLGEPVTKAQAKLLFDESDTSKKDQITFSDFCTCVLQYATDAEKKRKLGEVAETAKATPADEDAEEEDEIDPELANLSPEAQTRIVLYRACWGMGIGSILVCSFSDAAVNVFNEWGDRLGISAFYVSFLLAPFASNASELIVAYNFASKKSKKSITTSLSSLIGAACMNNTFCLGIFFCLVYFRNLAWKFKAETMSIMAVQWIVGLIVLSSSTQRKFMAGVILTLYPLCLLLVYALEKVVGWD
jgi:Ca2+/Na+ antiporter